MSASCSSRPSSSSSTPSGEHLLDLVEKLAHVGVVRPVVQAEPALEHLRFRLAHDSVGEDPLRESDELVNLPVRHGLRVARPATMYHRVASSRLTS